MVLNELLTSLREDLGLPPLARETVRCGGAPHALTCMLQLRGCVATEAELAALKCALTFHRFERTTSVTPYGSG